MNIMNHLLKYRKFLIETKISTSAFVPKCICAIQEYSLILLYYHLLQRNAYQLHFLNLHEYFEQKFLIYFFTCAKHIKHASHITRIFNQLINYYQIYFAFPGSCYREHFKCYKLSHFIII